MRSNVSQATMSGPSADTTPTRKHVEARPLSLVFLASLGWGALILTVGMHMVDLARAMDARGGRSALSAALQMAGANGVILALPVILAASLVYAALPGLRCKGMQVVSGILSAAISAGLFCLGLKLLGPLMWFVGWACMLVSWGSCGVVVFPRTCWRLGARQDAPWVQFCWVLLVLLIATGIGLGWLGYISLTLPQTSDAVAISGLTGIYAVLLGASAGCTIATRYMRVRAGGRH